MTVATNTVEKLLLAAPRGYCAGVDRAVETVERALDRYGAPVYVRKEIVHNKHVVEQLRARGAIFVDSETEVPEGSVTVFSAHGVAPSVHENARARRLQTIDATCPLVTKVHVEARRFAADGYTIVLVGHDGHEEVEGTMGEAPDQIVLVQSEEDVDALDLADPEQVAYISQTTLSVDETRGIIERLRERFPAIVGPRTDDICYATTNRQAAVRQLADELRRRARDRIAQLVQLAAAGRGRARLRRAGAPDRQRRRARGSVARRRAHASASPRARARPRSWSQELVALFRARGVERRPELDGDARGRPLHAAEDDSRPRQPASGLADAVERRSATRLRTDGHARRFGPAPRHACGKRCAAPRRGARRAARRARRRRAARAARRHARVPPGHGARRPGAGRPVLARLGERLGERPVVVVPGNHDHALVADWLARAHAAARRSSSAARRSTRRSPRRALAAMLAPAPVEIAYPGLWLADGVYATHGHYLDLHMTVPTLERLAVAAAAGSRSPGGGAGTTRARRTTTRRVVTPVYAWAHAAAQTGRASDTVDGGRTIEGLERAAPRARAARSLRARALAAAFPLAVRALNAAGLGPAAQRALDRRAAPLRAARDERGRRAAADRGART